MAGAFSENLVDSAGPEARQSGHASMAVVRSANDFKSATSNFVSTSSKDGSSISSENVLEP